MSQSVWEAAPPSGNALFMFSKTNTEGGTICSNKGYDISIKVAVSTGYRFSRSSNSLRN